MSAVFGRRMCVAKASLPNCGSKSSLSMPTISEPNPMPMRLVPNNRSAEATVRILTEKARVLPGGVCCS